MDIIPSAANKQASLVYSPHPICAGINRQLHYATFLPGENIAAYLQRLNIRIKQPALLQLNGKPVALAEWQSTRPVNGDIITARGLVQGGGDGGSDPLRTVLTIAVLVASQGTFGAELFAGFGAGAATSSALTAIGGMLLVNALVPLPEPPEFGDGSSPTYSLSGGSNRIRQFQPLPLVMGTHKIVPDLGAKPFTDFKGEDQYLYQCFNFGLSDITLSDYKIGDTPLTDYEINVINDLEESGTDGALTLFPGNVDSIAGGDLAHDGTWVQRTSSLDTVSLALDFNGIIYRIKSNNLKPTKAILRFEYRLVGSPTWLPFTGADIEIINNDRNPVRETISMDVTRGQYEVRGQYVKSQYEKSYVVITGSGEDATTSTEYIWIDNDINIDTVVIGWNVLKSFQADDADYTGQKRVALRIKATGQLQGAVDQFSAIASASCPAWSGASWATEANSNPAWWYLWFARGKYAASGVRLYGAGLADANIDIEAIKEWGAWCTSKGLTFNAIIDKKMSCDKVLKLIARCGRAAPTWATGKLGIIWDEANQPITNMYGMSNIRRGTFKINYLTKRVADEIIVNFVNPANNWQPDTVRQTVPGVISPQNPVTIDLFGCTSEALAGKEANLIAAEQAHRRRQISWETDMEGFVNKRGDVVGLSHDLTQWGYSGRVVFGTTTVLILDREVPFTPATSHYVGVRFPDGSYNIYDVVYQAGPTDTIVLGTPLPSAPDSDTDNPAMDYLWFFAPQATPGKKVKITDIRPLSEHHLRITATDEEDAYYLAENDTYTYVPPATFGATLPTINNLDIGDTLIKVGAGYAVRIAAVWDVTGEYGGAIVRASSRNQPLREMGKTLARRFEFQWDDLGEINIEVTLINLKGEYGTNSRSTVLYQVQGKNNEPSDVAIFTAQLQDFVIKLAWEPVEDIDIEEYEVRAGTDWASAVLLGNAKSTEYLHAMVTAGTHDFLVKAKDTTKNESLNAAAAQIIIAAPNQPTVSSRFDGENFILSWAASAGSFAVAEYEIRTGESWAAGDFVANIKGTSYSIRVDYSGTRKYWIAAIDAAGNFSEASNINATITVAAQPVITAEVIDNNVLLRWDEVVGTLPIKHYEIRRGAVFSTATVLQTVSGTFAAFFENEAGAYIYWLVAVDTANNFGTEVSIATNVNEPPDYQLNVDWYSTFSGTKTNALLMENGNVLMPVETGNTYEDHFINNGYSSPQDQVTAGFAHFIQPSVNTAVYEEEFDYGAVLPATLVKAAFSKTVVTGDVTITPTISTRKLNTDPWVDNVGQWLIFATDFQYVKVRLDIAAAGGDDLLQGHSLNVRLDTKLKNDAGGGTADAADVSGTPVAFNKTFIDVESITVSPNTTASVTAVYDFTDAPNPTGFNVLLFNANTGARVSGDFSWSAKGF